MAVTRESGEREWESDRDLWVATEGEGILTIPDAVRHDCSAGGGIDGGGAFSRGSRCLGPVVLSEQKLREVRDKPVS